MQELTTQKETIIDRDLEIESLTAQLEQTNTLVQQVELEITRHTSY